MARPRQRLRASRARLFQLALALALAVLAAACVPPAGLVSPINGILERHNSARSAANVPILTVDTRTSSIAQFHANRMAITAGGACKVWHSSSRELASWYPGAAAAENVACISGCPGDPTRLTRQWLDSPPHAANIYNAGYRYIGAGVACSNGTMYAAVHFRSG